MTEDEFLERWNAERPFVEAWGQFVAQALTDCISPLVAPVAVDIFVRIPPIPRVKGDGSILTKAFYRGKNYDDPLKQITDKVGVRFVVLLTTDIKIICQAVEACPDWEASKDRDYEEERDRNPSVFEYQSVHYVVRAKIPTEVGGVTVPAATPCEIQVRTLLQHAYSEVTHDTLYKPSVIKTPEMQRAASKSMALIEATNDYFQKLLELVEKSVAPSKKLATEMAALYQEMVGQKPDATKADGLISDAYEGYVDSPVDAVRELFSEKAFLLDRIRERAPSKLLFRQPSIMLAYVAVVRRKADAQDDWPLTPDELKPIYKDLGFSASES